jgi:two-component system, OmpR family, KDP operon response regulator KdpE
MIKNSATILVVDDEPQIRRVLRAALSNHGYDILEAESGEQAVEVARRERSDLILLDVNMPGVGGVEACRQLRLFYDGPIIIVTVRNAERDKVVALDSGADDFVVKPFSMEELLARIRASLRRSSSAAELPRIETPEFTIDLENRLVQIRGERVHLTPKEFDVLKILVMHEGKPLTHARILQTVWGPEYREDTENLRVVINQLRKKLEQDGLLAKMIVTEPWVGYRFSRPATSPKKTSGKKS